MAVNHRIRNTKINQFKIMSMYHVRKFPTRDSFQINDNTLSVLFNSFIKNKKHLDIHRKHIPQLKAALDSGNVNTLVDLVDRLNPNVIDWANDNQSGNQELYALLPWWALVLLIICLIIVIHTKTGS